MQRDPLDSIVRAIADARCAVAFTGAGISTESGIADFRSPGGVWARHKPVYFDEFLASHEARLRAWRMRKEMYPEFAAARPNAGHRILAEWERDGRIAGLITQNIDGLHEEAGSARIFELHGTARWVACLSCAKRWPMPEIYEAFKHRDEVPQCDVCGGWLKSATVSFGQPLPQDVLYGAYDLAKQSDVFLAIGSSLVVEPAASLPLQAKRNGAFLAIINREETPLDPIADAIVRESIGQTLEAIDRCLDADS